MKVFIRLIFLRFDIFKPETQQTYCPVGIFYRPEGASSFSNIVINYDSEMPGLPIILINLESVFTATSASDLQTITVAPLFASSNEFRLGDVMQVEVPDDMPKLDKYLFVTHIASQDRFRPAEGQKLYRRVMYTRKLTPSEQRIVQV